MYASCEYIEYCFVVCVQIRKAQERSEKCQKETEAARQRYTRALLDLDASNGKYMEDMVDVFDRTQTFEQRRLDFMKFILLELHNSLDYSQNQTLVFTLTCSIGCKALLLCSGLLLCVCALPGKVIFKMTYTVSGGTLSSTHSLTRSITGYYGTVPMQIMLLCLKSVQAAILCPC